MHIYSFIHTYLVYIFIKNIENTGRNKKHMLETLKLDHIIFLLNYFMKISYDFL